MYSGNVSLILAAYLNTFCSDEAAAKNVPPLDRHEDPWDRFDEALPLVIVKHSLQSYNSILVKRLLLFRTI